MEHHDRTRNGREAQPILPGPTVQLLTTKGPSHLRRALLHFGTVPRKLQFKPSSRVLHGVKVGAHVELGVGYASELIDSDLGGDLPEDQAAGLKHKHGVLSDDHVGLADAGDGEGALSNQLGLWTK